MRYARRFAVAPDPMRERATVRYAKDCPGTVRLDVLDRWGRIAEPLADGAFSTACTSPREMRTVSRGLHGPADRIGKD